jgi:metallo-beta-lactamase class B
MGNTTPMAVLLFATSCLLGFANQSLAQTVPEARPTKEQLASDNNLFISLAKKALKWEEPADPIHIVGPIYFVGTKGLGAFLFTTPEGHILMNTGMPSSGPMIVESIRKLGLKPEDIKILINGHAHIDHAGAFAFFKQQFGTQLAIMKDDVAAMESGDMGDFKYANDFVYPAVKVDRILRDGDQIKMGDILLTAYHTPGHTRGATTWVANIVVEGKAYVVAFPDGAGFNPGYRLVRDPSYSGIESDYRNTHHFLEMLKPDIWLAQHNEYHDLEGKQQRRQNRRREGVD